MTAEEKQIIQMIQEAGRKVVPPDGHAVFHLHYIKTGGFLIEYGQY
ncbi:MAG: hypothetical protein K5945_03450 [Bacteroidaceae bacterium]|nr:hypothetical protein [Bacteroidaceae bacterium]